MLTQTDFLCKLSRLYFLVCLIPADGTWEPGLSLALDAALVDLEGAG